MEGETEMRNLKTTKTKTTKEINPSWFIDYETYSFIDDDLKDYKIEKELYGENRSYYYLLKKNEILVDDIYVSRFSSFRTLKEAKERILLDIDGTRPNEFRQKWQNQSEDLSSPAYLSYSQCKRFK